VRLLEDVKLRIALEEIPEGVSTLELKCKPVEIGLEADDVYFNDPVIAKLKLFRQIDIVFINAEISVAIELECARCLKPVPMILEGNLENQYSPMPKFPAELIDDIGIGYYSGEYIELSEDFRESLLLELPFRVLCSEDCRGLCPNCGQDLNEENCNCKLESVEVANSKFALLAKILETKR
jgi:uncharacterized protein